MAEQNASCLAIDILCGFTQGFTGHCKAPEAITATLVTHQDSTTFFLLRK